MQVERAGRASAGARDRPHERREGEARRAAAPRDADHGHARAVTEGRWRGPFHQRSLSHTFTVDIDVGSGEYHFTD